MAGRKPFPQFNPFREYVMDELKHRKRTDTHTPTIAPFVRLTSCMEDPVKDYTFFSLGLHGYDKPDGTNIFDLTYGVGKDVVGYAYSRSRDPNTGTYHKKLIFADDISPNVDTFRETISETFTQQQAQALTDSFAEQHMKNVVPAASHPVPGITNVSVVRRGLGQPLIATIHWQCYNRGQMEFLRNHFLCTGNYIILEMGNQFSDRQIKNRLPFQESPDAVFNILQNAIGAVGRPNTPIPSLSGREFVLEGFSRPNEGNYDFIVGQISNFEINLEPETGIFKCMTKLVSQGENIWGITINRTFVSGEAVEGQITTIADYFVEGRFKDFIERELANGNKETTRKRGSALKDVQITSDVQSLSGNDSNSSDHVFVTWNFMTTALLQDMLSVIKDSAVRDEILHYAKLNLVLDDDYVGYHPLLRSAEPESMLLINKSIPNISSEFLTSGYFEPAPGVPGARSAKLNRGTWINANCIRESFMSAMDLRQAFSNILARLNRSVGGYWQLQLFWDEERACYRIIDYKYGTQHRAEKFYKFNVGGAGECLNIEFNSAFPPEMLTQMNLVAMFQTADSREHERYLKQYPLLGTTSAHMFMMNWTHLRDGLRQRVNQWRANTSAVPAQTAVSAIDKGEVSTQSRVSPIAGIGLLPATLGGQGRMAGENVSTTILSATPPDNTTIGAIRNSVTAPESPSPITEEALRKLNSRIAPVNGGTISSAFSPSRLHPKTHEPKPHKGVDIAVPTGTAVFASMDGLVTDSMFSSTAGNMIVIQHGSGVITKYFHLDKRLVTSGQKVSRGDRIADSGATGNVTGPHLHYEIIVNGTPVDPQNPTKNPSDPAGTVSASTPNNDAGLNEQSPTVTTSKPSSQQNLEERSAETKRIATQLRRAEVSSKFGDSVLVIIADHLGDMINNITREGYQNSLIPNSFVSPFPTTTSVAVEIMGIAGISVSDGFFVDKIPFLFEKHGIFQVTEVIDTVTSEGGWRTKVVGYFKMLWYDGNGGTEVIS